MLDRQRTIWMSFLCLAVLAGLTLPGRSETQSPQGGDAVVGPEVHEKGTKEKSMQQANGVFSVAGVARDVAIVIPDDARPWAANDLAGYLEQITGRRVPVVKWTAWQARSATVEGVQDLSFAVHVGTTPYVEAGGFVPADIHIDGYVIALRDDRNLVIAGGKHQGVRFAVYDFLKQFAGCRFFMPGPLGEVVPRTPSIKLPERIALVSNPSFPSAWFNISGGMDQYKFKSLRRYEWAGHNWFNIIPPQRFAVAHPEYYMMEANGRRVDAAQRGRRWQACVSSVPPEVVLEAARTFFAENPLSFVYSVGLNDGGFHCQCADCTRHDVVTEGGEQNLTDRYMGYFNRVAKLFARELPDKFVGVSAYEAMRLPPVHEPIASNMLVRICGTRSPGTLDLMQQWRAKGARHFSVYEYIYGRPILAPRSYPHVVADVLRKLHETGGMHGFNAEFAPFWPFDALKIHVIRELLWDIDCNVEELIEDFFTTFYAEARVPMRSFFDLCETIYLRREEPTFFFAGYRTDSDFAYYGREDLTALRGSLEQAAAAATGEETRLRVAMVREAFDLFAVYAGADIRRRECDALTITSQADAETALRLAEETVALAAERDRLAAKVQDPANYPSHAYHTLYAPTQFAGARFMVRTFARTSDAVDRALGRVTAYLERAGDKEETLGFWSARTPTLGDHARAQMFNLKRLQQVILSLDFEEKPQAQPEAAMPDADLFKQAADAAAPGEEKAEQEGAGTDEALGWRPFDYPPILTWGQFRLPVVFRIASEEARSGRRSIAITGNHGNASFNVPVAVSPGEKYRVSVWCVEREDGAPVPVGAYLSVRWQNAKGQWMVVPDFTAGPDPDALAWQELTGIVTVPDGACRMVVLLGTSKPRSDTASVYFDDLLIERVYVPEESAASGARAMQYMWAVESRLDKAKGPQVETALSDVIALLSLPIRPAETDPGAERAVRLILDQIDATEPEGAFRLRVAPDRREIRVSAGDGEGFRAGLYAVAEKCGVRFFRPDELPLTDRIDIEALLASPLDETLRPSFGYRGMHICGAPAHYDEELVRWMSRLKLNRKLTHHHVMDTVRSRLAAFGIEPDPETGIYVYAISNREYFDAHPEYFALIGGRRLPQGEGGQLCLANAAMRAAFADRVVRFARRYPEVRAVGISPNDGMGSCECTACRALDTPEDGRLGTINGRIADFACDIARRVGNACPALIVGHHSYSIYADFLYACEDLPPNLGVSYTVLGRCYKHALGDQDCPVNRPLWRRLRDYRAKTRQAYVYDYYSYRWDSLPAPIWETVVSDLRCYKALGLDGYLSEITSVRNRGMWQNYHLAYYLSAKLLWNADNDAEAMIADYCARYYGPAADSMRAYMETLAGGLRSMEGCFTKKPEDLARMFPPRVQAAGAALLERAVGACVGQPEFAARVTQAQKMHADWISIHAQRTARAPVSAVRALPIERLSIEDPLLEDGSALQLLGRTTLVPERENTTLVQSFYGSAEIGLRIDCRDTAMPDLLVSSSVFDGDHVEIFIAASRDSDVCYHFAVNPAGALRTCECQSETGQNERRWNWAWQSGCNIQVKRVPEGWRVTFRVARRELGLGDGSFYFGVARKRRGGITVLPDMQQWRDPRQYIEARTM